MNSLSIGLHFSPAAHLERIGAVRLIDAQGNVFEQLAEESVAQLPRRDEFPLPARKGTVVDGEVHLNRRLAYLDERHGVYSGRNAKRVAYGDVLYAAETHDVAHERLVHGHAFEPLNLEEGHHLAPVRRKPRIVANHHLFAHFDGPALDFAYAYAPDVVVVVDCRPQQLQFAVGVAFGRFDIIENCFEQGREVLARHVVVRGGGGVFARAIKDGAHELFVVRAEVEEQFQHLITHFRKPCVGAVYLVDDDYDFQSQRERLFDDETRLRHRSFRRVDEEQHAAHHFEHALHLSRKIGVTGSVDDVYLHAAPMHGRVFCEYGYAALALQISGVHNAGLHLLVFAEGARLAQHTVHERRLAVVNVRDDSDVSQIFSDHFRTSAALPARRFSRGESSATLSLTVYSDVLTSFCVHSESLDSTK